jgi:hypothetical protein
MAEKSAPSPNGQECGKFESVSCALLSLCQALAMQTIQEFSIAGNVRRGLTTLNELWRSKSQKAPEIRGKRHEDYGSSKLSAPRRGPPPPSTKLSLRSTKEINLHDNTHLQNSGIQSKSPASTSLAVKQEHYFNNTFDPRHESSRHYTTRSQRGRYRDISLLLRVQNSFPCAWDLW